MYLCSFYSAVLTGGSPQQTNSTHPKPQIDKFRRKFPVELPMETSSPSPVKSQKMSENDTALDSRSLDKPSHSGIF